MMTTDPCLPFREQLSEWIDGDLSPEASRNVCSHLEGCASCRRDAELLRTAIGAMQRFPAPPEPVDILAGVRKRLAPEPWYRRLLRNKEEDWHFGIPVGALATMLVIVGVVFFQAGFPNFSHDDVTPSFVDTMGKAGQPSKNMDGGKSPVPYPGDKALVFQEPSPAAIHAQETESISLVSDSDLKVLALLVRDESDLGELKKIIEVRGGTILNASTLDQQALRGIDLSVVRPKLGVERIREGWRLEVRLPAAGLKRLMEEIGRRPEYRFLQNQSNGSAIEIPPSKQNVRVFVFLQ